MNISYDLGYVAHAGPLSPDAAQKTRKTQVHRVNEIAIFNEGTNARPAQCSVDREVESFPVWNLRRGNS